MVKQLSLFDDYKVTKQLFEYFFLVSPNRTIKEIIKKFKQRLNAEISLEDFNLHSIAHISFFKVKLHLGKEEVIRCATEALAEIESSVINLNGRETYNHGNKRSLVLKVEDPRPLINIYRNLTRALNVKAESFDPHLTIARSITKEDLDRIPNLEHYNYSGSTYCDRITLLGRPTSFKTNYQNLGEIHLG